jgi:hypothetical protein
VVKDHLNKARDEARPRQALAVLEDGRKRLTTDNGDHTDLRIAETDLEEYHHFMPVVLPLRKMSRDEKLRAMEALWADLSKDEDRLESPAWHAQALREAERAVKSGKAKFSDWDEAKKRISRKAAKLA